MANSDRPDAQPSDTINLRDHAPQERKLDAITINEVQLLLAEKRTSLATLRTGIAVLVLPLSFTSFLIVTSKFYDIERVGHLLIPLLALNAALVVLGAYLIMRSVRKLRKYDRIINNIKLKYSEIAEFLG